MAKQTLNLNRVGGAATSNATPGSGNTLTFKNTGSIAYKIVTGAQNKDEDDENIWKKMLNPKLASDDSEKKPLIGLQIKFDEGNAECPKITQLCFDLNPSDKESYFFSGNCSMELEDNMSHDIIEMPDSSDKTIFYTELSTKTSAPADTGAKLYKQLDGYEDIDFVFFPLDQLKAMTDLYKSLIISGSKISPGKKLSHRPQANAADRNYKKDYFTLKIEGNEPTSDWDSQNATGPQEVGAAMLPGHPCPPDWQLFTAVLGAVYSKVSNGGRQPFDPKLINKIRVSFQTQVVHVANHNFQH